MRIEDLLKNPFSTVLIQILVMGLAFFITLRSFPDFHFYIEVVVIIFLLVFNERLKLHTISTSDRLAPYLVLVLLLILVISVLKNYDYYYYIENPMWVPIFVLTISLIFQFKNHRYSVAIFLLAFSVLAYSGSREYLLWFIFLHILKYFLENDTNISVNNFVKILIMLSAILLLQYTLRTIDSDFSREELRTSIERTNKRIAYPIIVSNKVFESDGNSRTGFDFTQLAVFFVPSFISENQKVVPGQQIQHVYFDTSSSINLPLTFAGQAKHYFGRYWSVGLVIFLLGLFLVFSTIKWVYKGQVSVSLYLITLFFVFRYDHGLYIVNNIFKILPLIIFALFILEKYSFVKKVKNLTY